MTKNNIVLPDKEWYKSASVWGAVALGAYGVWRVLNGMPIDIETVGTIAGAFGLYGIRKAIGNLL